MTPNFCVTAANLLKRYPCFRFEIKTHPKVKLCDSALKGAAWTTLLNSTGLRSEFERWEYLSLPTKNKTKEKTLKEKWIN